MIPLYDDNPTRTTPFVTIAFLAINILVFGFMAFSGQGFNRQLFQFGAIPMEIIKSVDLVPFTPLPVHANLLTSMFMHANFMHLAGNMLFLWIFGNNIEDITSHYGFIVFYILCGIGAVFTHILQDTSSQIPLVGASGAISGILGAYLLYFPRAKVYTLFWFIIFIRIIAVPAWIFIGIWFLIQMSNLGAGGEVAWGAHLGGFITGLLMIPVFSKKKLWSKS